MYHPELLQIGNITSDSYRSGIRLKVYANDSEGTVATFKHPNDSQGIGIKHDGIFQTNANAHITLTTSGSGKIYFNLNSAERFRITDAGLYFQNNTWHNCLNNNQRFNFAPNGTTYIRGHSTTPIEFRNTSDSAIMTFTSTGDIRAIGNISAYYSDERLKTITEYVSDVLPIISKINVFRYNCNDLAASYGYDKSKNEIGVSAQEIKKYYPELVTLAPFDSICDKKTDKIISKSGENYLTLNYERLVPILLQGIKELNKKYKNLEEKYAKIENILNIK